MKRKHAWVVLAVMVSGCGQDESGVITNKEPFYQRGYQLPLSQVPKTLSNIQRFAKDRGIHLLVSTNHFRDGEFSATLVADELNIGVTNVTMGDVAWITATARHDPTSADKSLLNQYLGSIGLGAATDDRQPPLKPPV